MNKTILNLKREVDTVKKTESEGTLELETLGKKSGNIDASISNRIQKIKERISGAEDSIENIHREHRHNNQRKWKMQKDPNSKHPGNPGHNEEWMRMKIFNSKDQQISSTK